MTPPPALARCPVCSGDVDPSDARSCPRCETPHHGECWDYVGDCAIFGCRPQGTGTASLPAEREERREIAALARWYTGLFRAHWWGFLAMSLPLPWFPFLGMLGYVVGLGWIGEVAFLAMFFGAIAYFALLVPMLLARWALERRLGAPLQPPRQGATALLESMEMTGSGGLLLAVVRRGPAVYGAFLLLLMLASGSVAAVLFWGLLAIPLLLGIRSATTQRVLMIEALQNRLLASLKEG